MSNVIQIKNGASAPSTSNLQPYELGYVRGGALYINNGGDNIIELANPNSIYTIDNKTYLRLPTIENAGFNTNSFLVCDNSGLIKIRSGDQILSDIGAFSSNGGVISGATTINSILTAQTLIVGSGNWGTSTPTGSGINGQLYFVLV